MQNLDALAVTLRDDDMRSVDAQVKAYAIDRRLLDAREAPLLRAVDEMRLWHWLGFPSIVAYVEDRLDLGVHAAMERMRTARELASLPNLEAALEAGAISYGHARELTRVATAETELAWLAIAEGKPAKFAQCEVRGRGKGDQPDSPRKPELVRTRVWHELSPERQAQEREARAAAEAECGHALDDDAFFAMVYRNFLERSGATDPSGTRPAYQQAVTTCRECKRGTVTGRGMEVDLTLAAVSRATCDAEQIGAVDRDDGERITATITPRTRRRVFARDGFRCVVPGCRSARNLDIHHVVFQEHGGSHHPSNLAVVCSAHHACIHDGRLSVTGEAPDALTFTFHRDHCLPSDDCECASEQTRTPRPRGDGEVASWPRPRGYDGIGPRAA